ncbi:hypothetical protein VCSRO192_3488 [Vibrio cholerae]|nr:hypothetical protein VCSRO192_3488 [Vibrio cholerae]
MSALVLRFFILSDLLGNDLDCLCGTDAFCHQFLDSLYGVLGIFRPKTTKCSGGRAVRGLQRGITFR